MKNAVLRSCRDIIMVWHWIVCELLCPKGQSVHVLFIPSSTKELIPEVGGDWMKNDGDHDHGDVIKRW